MFWFINTRPVVFWLSQKPIWQWYMFYNGNRDVLKYALDQDQAEKYFKNYEDFDNIYIDLLDTRYHFNVPKVTSVIREEGKDYNKEFMEFYYKAYSDKLIDHKIHLVLSEFSKQYRCIVHDWLPYFVEWWSTASEIPDWGLIRMKEFMLGIFMNENFKINYGKDKQWKPIIKELPLANDYNIPINDWNSLTKEEQEVLLKQRRYPEISYKTNDWIEYTPIYWVYAPAIRQLMFSGWLDFGDGRLLQKWQLETLLECWEENYVACSGGSGKTLLLMHLAQLFSMRATINPREKYDWQVIHYYGISNRGNLSAINKMLAMNKQITDDNRKLFEWREADKTLSFYMGDQLNWYIEFFSGKAEEPGRGWRPTAIIVDEAAKQEKYVKELIDRHSWIPKFYISTINKDSKRGWFFEWLLKAEIDSMNRKEKTIDLLVRLWKKYWFDKVKSRQEIVDKYDDLVNMRQDFFKERRAVALRYTIWDIEYKSTKEKTWQVEQAMKNQWLQYTLAEHYSRFIDDDALFKTEWLITKETPEFFDSIAIGYDPATKFDNPAAVCIGTLWSVAYVYKSIILDKDNSSQREQVRNIKIEESKRLRNPDNFVILAMDVTQNVDEMIFGMQQRWINVDVPIYTAKGNSTHNKKWVEYIGKWALITIIKEYFENRNIFFDVNLNVEKWLIEELQYYSTESTWGAAVKGKDDQVSAMMLALYVLHQYGLKYKIIDQEKFIKSDEKEYDKRMLGYKEKEWYSNWIYDWLYANFGY